MEIQEIPAALAEYWQPAETAPRDGNPFLADTEYPWPLVCAWNDAEKMFVCAQLNVNMFEGKYNDTYFESEQYEEIKAWMPLPAVKG